MRAREGFVEPGNSLGGLGLRLFVDTLDHIARPEARPQKRAADTRHPTPSPDARTSVSLWLQGSDLLNGFRTCHEVKQLRRDLVLAGLTRVLLQLFELFQDIFMSGLHCSKTRRVFAGESFERGLGQ